MNKELLIIPDENLKYSEFDNQELNNLTINNKSIDDTTFTNNMVYMYYTGTLNIGEIKTFTDLQKAINTMQVCVGVSDNGDKHKK